MKRISATNDLAFKKVLASEENKDILAGFIHDFFGIIPEEIVINNPYSILDYKEINEEDEEGKVLRQTFRDISVSCKTADFTTELQVSKTAFFDERCFYYPFNRYCQNYNDSKRLKKDKKGKPNRYSSLKPVYALNIMAYDYFEEDEDSLRIFELYDQKRKKVFKKELIKIGFFELKKDNIETKNQKYWRDYFLTGIVSEKAPEYIKKASKILEFVNLDKEEQMVAEALEKAIAIYDAECVYISDQKEEIEEMRKEVEDRKREVEDKEKEVEDKEKEVEDKQREVEDRKREVEDKQREVEDKEKEIQNKERTIREREMEGLVLDNLEENIPYERIIIKIQKRFSLSEKEAREYLNTKMSNPS